VTVIASLAVYCELIDEQFTLCYCYFRHSEELIKRLEQAGLGYHVDADKTTDRFGTEYSIIHMLCRKYFPISMPMSVRPSCILFSLNNLSFS